MSIAQFLDFETRIFLVLLGGTVAFQLLTGRISTRNLLRRKAGSKETSPERIQLLFATIPALSLIFLCAKPAILREEQLEFSPE